MIGKRYEQAPPLDRFPGFLSVGTHVFLDVLVLVRKSQVKKGHVEVLGAVFDNKTGRVEFLGTLAFHPHHSVSDREHLEDLEDLED